MKNGHRISGAERGVKRLPGPRAGRTPREMTSGERGRRIDELIARAAASEGIDPTDSAAVFQRLALRADERGDHGLADRWRVLAEQEGPAR